MHSRLVANVLRGPLTHLSLTKGAPRVLTNDERAREFRAVLPSPPQNSVAWNFKETFRRPSPACLPSPQQQARGLSPDDAPDWAAFATHSYSDLSQGF